MQPPDEQLGPLSVHRAFVVQFDAHTDVARGRLAGRVEHVVSGQALSFIPWRPCWRSWGSCCVRGTARTMAGRCERRSSSVSVSIYDTVMEKYSVGPLYMFYKLSRRSDPVRRSRDPCGYLLSVGCK